MNCLSISNLSIGFLSPQDRQPKITQVVDNVSLDVPRGACVGIVGESGSGKSVTAMSILRLLPQPAGKIMSGSILFNGRDVTSMSLKQLNALRGNGIGTVFQEPMTSLNPVHTIGTQIAEPLILHKKLTKKQAHQQALQLLEQVHIPHPAACLHAYPHQLSGGMRQRVMLAIAIACQPDLIIADEPTTALDTKSQGEIMQLLRHIRHSTGAAVLLITHDLHIIRQECDQVHVMYAGRIIEHGKAEDIFIHPQHAYTRALLAAVPHHNHRPPPRTPLPTIPGQIAPAELWCTGCRFCQRLGLPQMENEPRPAWEEFSPTHGVEHCPQCSHVIPIPSGASISAPADVASPEEAPTVLTATHLSKTFSLRRGIFRSICHTTIALDDVSLTLARGETLGIVGESGCGKSTLARCLIRLDRPDSGTIVVMGQNWESAPQRTLRPHRHHLQMVFQDPAESLNPRMSLKQILTEPFQIQEKGTPSQRVQWAQDLLHQVGLPESALNRYPFEFSGGQRQRIGIARALALRPDIIILDEPISALDVSVQAQILNLLLQLQADLGISYIFISHNADVVRHIAHRVIRLGP